MKIFVSKYWQINILVFIILECMGIIGISSMCIPDLKEGRIDIISLAYGLGAVALAAFLLFRMRNVMQYVIIGSGYAVTQTATGKTVCQVCLDKPFYCIVVTLVVAVGSTQQFILLSNDTIDVDLILSISGLATLCNKINKEKTQVLLPYNQKTASILKNENCIRV